MIVLRKLPLATLFSAAFAVQAFAAGGLSDTAPTQTETTVVCPEGAVYDASRQACVIIQDSNLETETLIQNVRELAYFDRLDDARELLNLAAEPEHTMVLTYQGFTTRRAGDLDTALDFYDRALLADPDNILARSYMGMAFLLEGNLDLAQAQLDEIRNRGGAGTWPETALLQAIETGVTINY